MFLTQPDLIKTNAKLEIMEKAIFRILFLGLFITSTFVFSQATYDYTGQVKYQVTDEPMSNVTVKLSTLDGTVVQTVLTDNLGYYVFDTVTEGTYKVNFTTDQPAGGIELCDAYMIEQYLAGNMTFSEIQKLAADVNGDDTISSLDWEQITYGYLNGGNPFPVGEWVFETKTITILGESGDGDVNLGSSAGDISGSLVPDPKNNQINLETPVLSEVSPTGEPIRFELTSDYNLEVAGMHLAFSIPEHLSVTNVTSALPGARFAINDRLLKITWINTRNEHLLNAGATILTIEAEMMNTRAGDETYRLVLKNDSHFMDAEGNLLSGISLTLPAVQVSSTGNSARNAYPNPFIGSFTIEYELPAPGMVNTMVFDQYGRKLTETGNNYKQSGMQNFRIDGSAWLPGIYYYRIILDGNTERNITGSIIKSK